MPNSEDDVGYGKPPKDKQFKPGQSGNPRGRPKKTNDFEQLFERELSQIIRITENGQTITLTKREGISKRVSNDALLGKPYALRWAVDFMMNHVDIDSFPADAADERTFERSLEQYKRSREGEDGREEQNHSGDVSEPLT